MKLKTNGKYIYIPNQYKEDKKLIKFLQDNNLIQDFIMDPAGYTYQDDMCKALIIESSVPEETTLFAAGEEEVIKSALSGISEAQCLLDVKFGETKKKLPFAYSIVKIFAVAEDGKTPIGISYTLNMNIKYPKYYSYINADFSECGTTGMRESLVHLMIDGLIGEDNLKNEFYMPYKTKKKCAGIHISEREAWDNFIPKHPLSQLRKMISFIIDNN